VHVPSEPDSAHDVHAPAQAALQHTPCAQNVDWHSADAEHDAPMAFSPHELLLHVVGEMQFWSVVQALKQELPLHT
jgi:hypothetical protein